MKSPSSQMPSAAILPSPVLLWRFKILLFMILGFSCCKVTVNPSVLNLYKKIGWDSAMIMNADLCNVFLYEVFLYYNPLLLMTLMVWLWGVNLWVFYRPMLVVQKYLILIKITSLTKKYGSDYLLRAIRLFHVTLYIASAMVLIFPFDSFYLSSRYFLLRTLWRIALPLQAITLPDFFLADILTSMAKVFSDLECSVCRMVHQQVATVAWLEADSVCGSHSFAIPLVLMFPYLFHLFQCLCQYKDTKEKTTLFNGNSSCGFSRVFKFSKPSLFSNLFYGRKWIYYWAIGTDLILRCTWTYKFSAHLRHNYLTVFTVTALEILRCFQWIFFRVENEFNKISRSSLDQLPLTVIQAEEEKLLGTINHSV